MTTISLHPGDNRESLRRLIDEGVRVHSVVTDPPYGLVSIQKRFGKEGAAPARTEKNDGSFARLSGGFVGKTWDSSAIERDPDFWKLIYDILLPGGYVFAFSGSRTGHWQACAMETAGFIMHPMHGWCFGSGLPKQHSLKDETWSGWAHGTQTQKPALEPIYLGQKPFSQKTAALNVAHHGVGLLNLKDCKVGQEDRHPSNLIIDGSPEVAAIFPNDNERFFHQFAPDTDPLIYQPKAGKADRAGSKHPTVKPIALMQYLVRHITPPGGVVLDPFAGSGTTAEAAKREGFDCILMEAEPEYLAFLRQRFAEISEADEDVNSSSFSVCSHSHKVGIHSQIIDLSDLF